MREKPSVDDIRYWKRSEGGQGFRHPAEPASTPSRQYAAARTYDQHRNLVDDPTKQTNVSIVAATADYTPDTVKSRARAVMLLAIERMGDKLTNDAQVPTLNELSQSVSALGRVSGVATDEQKDSTVHIHIVRDELPPHVTARMLSSGASEAQPVEAYDVSVDEGQR